ncbi:unnamed protein product [Menidia menidia]|uniref:(Atlantic silverside) hypothetical protein n=1 Tax=Menidia menidia TaxID=238744 RepID=A0A8S4APR7_9TELE|nr:unnamed protein product [Menidia menidia]
MRFNRKSYMSSHRLHIDQQRLEPYLIMVVNSTCVHGNGTNSCLPPSSPSGLAVGLTLFFACLVVITGVIVYKFWSKIRILVQRRQSQDKEDFSGTPDPAQQFASPIREQPLGQTPIYENLSVQTAAYKKPAQNQGRSLAQPEEDLYLQCDPEGDAIYSNDPAFTSNIQDTQDEDLYVVPDSS